MARNLPNPSVTGRQALPETMILTAYSSLLFLDLALPHRLSINLRIGTGAAAPPLLELLKSLASSADVSPLQMQKVPLNALLATPFICHSCLLPMCFCLVMCTCLMSINWA